MLRIRQLEVRAGQAEIARGQALAQLVVAAEEADRPQVDPGIAGGRDRVEDADAVGHVRIDAHGQLERAIADGSVGDDDAGPGPAEGSSFMLFWWAGRPVGPSGTTR